jgi:hypothetical protein
VPVCELLRAASRLTIATFGLGPNLATMRTHSDHVSGVFRVEQILGHEWLYSLGKRFAPLQNVPLHFYVKTIKVHVDHLLSVHVPKFVQIALDLMFKLS